MRDYWDNRMAYEDEREEESEDAYEDYLLQKQQDEEAEKFEASEYESKMAQQLIDGIYDKM